MMQGLSEEPFRTGRSGYNLYVCRKQVVNFHEQIV